MIRSEKIGVEDSLHNGQGKMLAKTNEKGRIIGQVEVIYQSPASGKNIFTRNLYENDLLVTGAVFLSEKVNNMRSTFKTVPIDVELGVHDPSEVQVTKETIPQEYICGLMIGNGGCGDTYNTVHKVHRYDRLIPGTIPYRVVPLSDELDEVTRKQYFLRVVKGEYAYYYGKKFDTAREINVQFEDGTVVPTNVDTLAPTKFIKTFTKYTLTLTEADVREYFKVTQGSTMRSLVNSVGLVTGYPGKCADDQQEEFFNVRAMTTLNMENSELKDSEATITFVYRLYFV